jgi:sulfoxide reductase heme-binding subunit YedZ
MPLRKPATLPEGAAPAVPAAPAPPAAWRSALRAAVRAALRSPWAKPVLFVICLGPMAWLLRGIWLDDLGANPAEFLIRATGDWTLRALCLVLAVTPLRVTLGLPELARLRRMLGLFTGFYACLHLIGYAWLDMGWDLPDITADIAKRPFILVGFAGWLLLSVLSATSFNAAIRALGAKRWQVLHRAVYAVAALALLHFFWMRAGKQNFAEVAVYAAILGSLLGWRAHRAWRSARPQHLPPG